jgi:hypothetical protein
MANKIAWLGMEFSSNSSGHGPRGDSTWLRVRDCPKLPAARGETELGQLGCLARSRFAAHHNAGRTHKSLKYLGPR